MNALNRLCELAVQVIISVGQSCSRIFRREGNGGNRGRRGNRRTSGHLRTGSQTLALESVTTVTIPDHQQEASNASSGNQSMPQETLRIHRGGGGYSPAPELLSRASVVNSYSYTSTSNSITTGNTPRISASSSAQTFQTVVNKRENRLSLVGNIMKKLSLSSSTPSPPPPPSVTDDQQSAKKVAKKRVRVEADPVTTI